MWENPDPTAQFTTQTVTLLDSINNYDYLKFTFKSKYTVNDISTQLINISEFKKLIGTATDNYFHSMCSIAVYYNTYALSRRVLYINDTSIQFTTCYYMNAAGATNQFAIPVSIIGIKGSNLPSVSCVPLIINASVTSGTNSISLADYTDYKYIFWLGTHPNTGAYYYRPANCTEAVPTYSIQQKESHGYWTRTFYGVVSDISATSAIDYYTSSGQYSLIGIRGV